MGHGATGRFAGDAELSDHCGLGGNREFWGEFPGEYAPEDDLCDLPVQRHAEDALDLAAMALDKTTVTDPQRAEICADVTIVGLRPQGAVWGLVASPGQS